MQNDYKIVDNYVITPLTLGRGAFGVVKRGYKQDEPEKLVAVKVMPIDQVNQNKNFVKLLKRELDILPQVENPYIVKLYHASRTKNNFYMFLEYCNGGDLKELLKKRGGKLSEAEAVTYFKHIVEGFKGIYQENVIHRDIKPANVLLHDGIAKISDFGFARVVTDMEQVDQFTLLGTPLYMAPQILVGDQFSAKCDIWSLGMLFYELLYGVTPWNASTQTNLAKAITTKELSFPETPKRSQMVKDILSKMLVVKEEDRISWYELFESNLIKSDESKILLEIQQINQDEKDPLDKQAKLNDLYVENNRVMNPTAANTKMQNYFQQQNVQEGDNMLSQNDKDSSSQQSSQAGDQSIQPGMKFNQVGILQNIQDNQLDRRLVVLKLDSYLTFNRNVGIFVNFTTNSIFKLFKDGLVKFPNHLFYRIIFLLQKYQMIQFQSLIDIMASKLPIGQSFTPADWKSYKKSQEFFTTLKAIKSDTAYIRPYFNEIFQRTSDFLQQNKQTFSPSETAEIKEFQNVLTKEFSKDSMPFFAIYEKTLVNVLKIFAQQLFGDGQIKGNRLVLQSLKFLKICLDPFKTFKWEDYQPMNVSVGIEEKKEFNQFYEYYETMDQNKLLIEIKEDLKQLQ